MDRFPVVVNCVDTGIGTIVLVATSPEQFATYNERAPSGYRSWFVSDDGAEIGFAIELSGELVPIAGFSLDDLSTRMAIGQIIAQRKLRIRSIGSVDGADINGPGVSLDLKGLDIAILTAVTARE
jgi:hypothetical protein